MKKTFYVDYNETKRAKPNCRYCVKKRIPPEQSLSGEESYTIVCKIPDYLSNPIGVAEGIAEILNRERKLILPI